MTLSTMTHRFSLLLVSLLLLMPAASAQSLAALSAQDDLAVRAESASVADALAALERAHRVTFLYESTLVAGKMAAVPEALSPDLDASLTRVLAPHGLRHVRIGEAAYVVVPEDEVVEGVDTTEPARLSSAGGLRHAARAPQRLTMRAPAPGRITGTVFDDSDQPLPGAQVTIVGTMRGTVTDAAGSYTIAPVDPGTYTVRAQFVGFRADEVEVTVPDGGTATQDFALETDLLQMDEAVVTASFNPRSKLESSVAITTLSPEDIETQAPRSTADLLKAIPGFYVESSGGEGGNNLFARGIPADGSFRYVTMQTDGLPVYESPELAFTNIDLLFRIDETVDRMEGVRGGSASIFASNAPAGIINFVSKTGGQELGGLAKVTGGLPNGLFRVDGNVGGPMGDMWRFNVGGFYRYDEGIRHPGFAANKGGQLRANVTRLLGEAGNQGYVRLYGTYLNDQNTFYLPIPLQDPDDPAGIEGFDPNYGTMTNLDAALVRVPGPYGTEFVDRDLTQGMNPVLGSLQAELFFDLGDGLSIKNAARAMQSDVTFNAIFSLSNPFDARGYAEALADEADAAGYAYAYTYADGAFEPADANGNGLVAETGWWHVDKPLSNFTNNVQIALDRETPGFGTHSLNAGLYFSTYSADELWHWHDILTDVSDTPRMLDLVLLDDDGEMVADATDNGIRRYGSLYRKHQGTGTVFAVYAGDDWEVTDRFRLDLGGRFERGVFRGKVERAENVDLDGDASTLFDNSFATGTGFIDSYDHTFDEWAASVGANVRMTETLAFFARGSRGFRMPDFDQWAGGGVDDSGEVEEIWQAEGGVKFSSPHVAVFAAAFYSSLTNIPFADEVVLADGRTVPLLRFADSSTPGLELEVIGRFEGLRANLTATLQDPTYSGLEFDDPALADEIADDAGVQLDDFDFDGNRVRRIPQVVLDFRPSYRRGPLNVFASARYFGERFVDDANVVTLPAYYVLGAGASVDVGQARIQLVGSNLTNTIGLTEGNPRVGQVVGVEQDIYMARPVLGRSARLSVAYRF